MRNNEATTGVIYQEYYSHENGYCYKINLPYTKYAQHTIVLCKVSEGLDKAKEIARKVLIKRIDKVLEENKPI